LAVGSVALVLAGVGCGGGGRPVTSKLPESYENLRAIADSYLKATKTLGHPPQNLDEFLPFLKKIGPPEKLLRSPEDGEDYKIVWGIDLNRAGTRNTLLAYEQKGKSGQRYVLLGHHVTQMTDEAFEKASKAPATKGP
jgi:hypothetical protein